MNRLRCRFEGRYSYKSKEPVVIVGRYTFHHLVNMTEQSVSGEHTALCRINLTTCYRHLGILGAAVVDMTQMQHSQCAEISQ